MCWLVITLLVATTCASPLNITGFPKDNISELQHGGKDATGSDCPGVTVFSQGEGIHTDLSTRDDKGTCYREPTIIRTSKGTMLAFTEQRLGGCADGKMANIVMKRSTDDGKSWSEIISVVKGGFNGGGNPVEGDGGVILVHYGTKDTRKQMQIQSHDDGEPAAAPQPLYYLLI